jgi:hypothetical protein
VEIRLGKEELHGFFARRDGGAEQRSMVERPSLDVYVGSGGHEKPQTIREAHAGGNTSRRLQDPPLQFANGVGIRTSFQEQSDDLGIAG